MHSRNCRQFAGGTIRQCTAAVGMGRRVVAPLEQQTRHECSPSMAALPGMSDESGHWVNEHGSHRRTTVNRSDDDNWVWLVVAWGVGLLAPPITLLVPAAYHAWEPVRGVLTARAKRKAEERRKAALAAEVAAEQVRQRQLVEEYRRNLPPPPPPPPPPPTADELRTAARSRFESTVRSIDSTSLSDAEKHHAREMAKQTLFRELDRLMTR